MDDQERPHDHWPAEAATSPEIPNLKERTGDFVMEIRGASDIILRREGGSSPETDEDTQTINNLNEALELLRESHAGTQRTRVRLILCMQEPYAPEPIIEFLEHLQEIPDRPQVTLSGCDATQKIEELVDEVQSAQPRIELVNSEPPGSGGSFPGKGEKFVEVSLESYESAKMSPLPALKLNQFREMIHDPDLTRQPKHPDIHVVSAIDFDGSIYENDPEYGIVLGDLMRFVKARNSMGFAKGWGNLRNLDEAIGFCEKWARERELSASYFEVPDPIKYKQGIIVSDTQSAAGFKGMPIEHLRELSEEFVATSMKGRFYGHAPLILQLYHDYGVLPFLVTGMPHVLVRPICKKMHQDLGIGITHGNGLLYELEGEGRDRKLTGRVEHYKKADGSKEPFHMGTPKGKAKNCFNVIRVGYGLAGAVGDSEGDLGIWGSSIRRMPRTKWDWDGGAILLEAGGDVGENVDDNFSLDIEEKRFEVLNRKKSSPEAVYDAAKRTMESVFEADISNIENIKRIRDILRDLGFPDEEKREIMSEHYPEHIVDAALKDHNVNTRNENDFDRYLRLIGATDEQRRILLIKNRHYYQKRNVTMVPLRKKSSIPPPLSEESETSNETD